MVDIIVEKGGVEVHRFPVEGDLTIGRAASAQVRLDDMRVHRAHARLLWQSGHLCILDLETTNGTIVDGRRIRGVVRFERTAAAQIGPYTLRRADGVEGGARNPALDENTGSDEDSGLHAAVTPRLEVSDASMLQQALPHVRVGRHFVFVDDAAAALAQASAAGRAKRLTSYRQRRGRVVKALADGAVEIAGGKIHAAPFEVERLASIATDRTTYVAGKDVARLIVALPGGGRVTVRVTHEGVLVHERELDVERGVAIDRLPLVASGRYHARLLVGGALTGEPVPFFAVARGAAVDHENPATSGFDSASPVLHVRSEPLLTLAGELGRELVVGTSHVAGPRPDAFVRGLSIVRRDHLGTPLVIDEVVAEQAAFRAVADLEQLVIASFDPARDAFSVFELGDVPRGALAHVDVPRPMCVAFVGCFVNGEPFEAFTTLFAPERPLALSARATGSARERRIVIAARTGRSVSVPAVLRVRTSGAPAGGAAHSTSSAPLSFLATSTRRAIAAASTGLGDEFRYANLEDLVPRTPPRTPTPAPPPSSSSRSSEGRVPSPTPGPSVPSASAEELLTIRIHERSAQQTGTSTGNERVQLFEGNELSLGRVLENDVVLPKGNVSKKHARLARRDGRIVVVDLKSTNGTWVNGKRITVPVVLKARDRISIGDFTIEIEHTAVEPAQPASLLDDSDDDELFGDAHASPVIERGVAPDEYATKAMRGHTPPKGQQPSPSPAVSPQQGQVTALPGEAVRVPLDAMNAQPRGDEGRVLFCGVVEVIDGEELSFALPFDVAGPVEVDVLAVDGGDFTTAHADVEVGGVRVALDVPAEVGDEGARGHVHVQAYKSAARVRVRRDGKDIPLTHAHDGRAVSASDALTDGATLTFEVAPGAWSVSADDLAGTDEGDAVEARVGVPGVRRYVARELMLLDRSKTLALDAGMTSLRVLPGVDAPLSTLCHALLDAPSSVAGPVGAEVHAARACAAATLLASSATSDLAQRARAEDALVHASATLKACWRKGRGFARFAEQTAVSERVGTIVVRALWTLDVLSERSHALPSEVAIHDVARDALAMAADVANVLSLQRVPDRVETLADAALVATHESRKRPAGASRQREALELVARLLVNDDAGPRLRQSKGRVADRAALAHAATALFAAGKVQTGIRVANEVLRSLDGDGRLYAVVDSLAVIALLVQIKKCALCAPTAPVSINGKRTTAGAAHDAARAHARNDRVEVIEARDAPCLVEVRRGREDRWTDSVGPAFPVTAELRDATGGAARNVKRGDALELVVTLGRGCAEGDYVELSLPAALALANGELPPGGRARVDLAGCDEARLRLVVVDEVQGRQRFACAVRNAFEEERVASVGMLTLDPA